MKLIKSKKLIKIKIKAILDTPLIIKSGEKGDITDSVIQKTPDGRVFINGYVIASLFHRASSRLKNDKNLHKFINPNDSGVSLFWVENSFFKSEKFNIVPGIKIDRELGTAKDKALYSDEVVPKGEMFEIKINFFVPYHIESENEYIEIFSEILGVIDSGIENIGGLWSYGYGRLKIAEAFYKILNLETAKHRSELWQFDSQDYKKLQIKKIIPSNTYTISKGWHKINVEFQIPEGQMFAIHSDLPIIEDYLDYPHAPDKFVFRTYVSGNPVITIPGKALRQAVFSNYLERKWRTKGLNICNVESPHCNCHRCKIFGSQNHRGYIAVTDGYIDENAYTTEIISRIELCEHSFQNKNLFAEEFLISGKFQSTIFIDKQSAYYSREFVKEIENILENMSDNTGHPPHWFRIGANTTCAGIIKVNNYNTIEV